MSMIAIFYLNLCPNNFGNTNMSKGLTFNTIFLRIISLIVISMLCSFQSYSQNSIPENIRKNIALSSQAIDNNDSTIAYERAKEALENAKNNSDLAIAISQLQLGKVQFFRKKYADSYQYFWKSYSYFKRKKETNYSIEALYGMGSLFEQVEVWPKALVYLNDANDLLSLTTKTVYRIPIKLSLANCYFQNKDYNNAIIFYDELRKFSIQYKDIENEIFAGEQMALCFSAENDFDKAISIEMSLLDKYARLNNNKSLVNSYYQIGLWYQKLKKYKQAETFYELSQSKNKSDSLFVVLEYRKAELASNTNNYSRSSDIVEKLLANKDLHKYQFWHIKTLNLWVLNAYYRKDYTSAFSRSDSLKSILNTVSEYDLKIMILHTLAVIYEQSDDLEQSVKYYKQLDKVRIQYNLAVENAGNDKFLKYQELNNQETHYKISNLEITLGEIELEKLRVQKENDAQQIKLLREQQRRRQLIQQNKILEKEKENEALIAKNKTLQAERKQVEAEKIIQENKLNQRLNKAELEQLQNEKAIADEKNRRMSQNRIYLAIFIVTGIIVFIFLLKAYLKNRKLNQVLEDQNSKLDMRRKETEDALQKVKDTQSQLIESERLASLGQLTAGIAHEIRNPLNFVNNFSSLITELLDELEDVLKDIDIPEGEQKEDLLEILSLIAGNNDKVNKHGVRASEIISRMLDASRGGVNEAEETDLNQLVMDSVKLSYQGFRGESTNFNLDLKFDLDENIGNEKVVHQDLGRVIINIANNACHAMEDKLVEDKNYKPILLVKTINFEDYFSILIEDNGKGMSEELQAKIFNPFFTTKPAGKGTGLGLTMTYDIVTKMHNGKIRVESKEGDFTRFIIEIPKQIN